MSFSWHWDFRNVLKCKNQFFISETVNGPGCQQKSAAWCRQFSKNSINITCDCNVCMAKHKYNFYSNVTVKRLSFWIISQCYQNLDLLLAPLLFHSILPTAALWRRKAVSWYSAEAAVSGSLVLPRREETQWKQMRRKESRGRRDVGLKKGTVKQGYIKCTLCLQIKSKQWWLLYL